MSDDQRIREEKAALRAEMAGRRQAIPPGDVQAASAQACRHLLAFVRSRGARRVALFASMRGELDPRGTVAELHAASIEIAFPRVAGKRRLTFHPVDDLATLTPSRLGIPEPAPDRPEVVPSALDLIVTPGLAFDREGGRLGWGGGYYDATLARAGVPSAGFFHSFQLVDAVPRTSQDHRVDFLVSELGIWPSR
jgi:5-formyltetrahydrofolate cyclo-ligase